MPQIINTNIMSLNSQRQLNKSQLTQNQAMERLSSGLRINSAKDDAAGLAISTGMQSQIRGINQAVRNANDGISMSQTAEGSMDEMTNILQRMRELSVQAANDTNSAENKASIQKEVEQLYTELDRIAKTTQFNGTQLLDGSGASTTLQIGANSGESLTFAIEGVTTADLGLDGGVNKGDLNSGRVTGGVIAAGDVAINGVDISEVVAPGGADQIEKAINLETASTGVIANAYNVVEGQPASSTVTGITNGLEFTVGSDATVTLGPTSSMANLAETINRDVEGVTASVGDSGNLILNNDSGESITIGGLDTERAKAGLEQTPTATANDPAVFQGYLGLTSTNGEPISVGAGTTGVAGDNKQFGFLVSNGSSVLSETPSLAAIGPNDAITINGISFESAGTPLTQLRDDINFITAETGITATISGTAELVFTAADGKDMVIASDATSIADRGTALAKLGVNEVGGTAVTDLDLSVSTSEKAIRSLDRIDSALDKISESRASLGAIQNRLGSTISNLENVSQNLAASNSRIQDADFAAETSKMSKAQILQQAGTSMLAQANASTQNVLSLLQG